MLYTTDVDFISKKLLCINMVVIDRPIFSVRQLHLISLVHSDNYVGSYKCEFCYNNFYHPIRAKFKVSDNESICKKCRNLVLSYRRLKYTTCDKFKIVAETFSHNKGMILIDFKRNYDNNLVALQIQIITINLMARVLRSRKNTQVNKYIAQYIKYAVRIKMLLNYVLQMYYIEDVDKLIMYNYVTCRSKLKLELNR